MTIAMDKMAIKRKYQNCEISFDYAVQQLKSLGFEEWAAEEYLYAEGY